ncbi:SGNH/GDSL hydrolase family protein [Actinomadura atramentaria]|uniref:SGNH/GDSL hydrolase family protein n=1 Tax=Actinomadura atramentaria TaxID=1990 RepID=UPI0003721E9F|nr:SGNH/GDSL hydrolase family protein [Actinomadura atramentaria]
MRRPRLRTVAAGTAITAASLLTAGPASAAGPAYVALGDSYSSGTGTGSYDPSAGDCQRSGKAYPRLWAAEHKPAKFAFAACAGATTSTVQSAQLGALHRNTRLVSITVGGNDADFAGVMQVCVIQSAANCETAVGNAENVMKRTLPGRLDKLYAGIHRRSPSARVVVLGYPHLYTIVSGCVGIGNAKRTVLNRAADTLDETVRRAAARARFVFADVRPRFAGHELCSGQGWLNAVTIPFGSSYHPTARGHAEGYLPVFSAAVDRALENAAAR